MVKDNSKDTLSRAEFKEKILLEAIEAFRKNGIKRIRMDDIATELKMSKRTLYEIFEDKETLLKECILFHQAQHQRTLEIIVGESRNVLEVILKCYKNSIEMYHKTNRKFFEEMRKYPKVYDMIINNREHDNTVVVNFLQRGVDQGIFRDDIKFEIIHALLCEQMDMLMHSPICRKFSFPDVYEAIVFVYLRGIVTPEGLEQLDRFICESRQAKHTN